jgi:hypothetical protein
MKEDLLLDFNEVQKMSTFVMVFLKLRVFRIFGSGTC